MVLISFTTISISIHAPHEGERPVLGVYLLLFILISIHAPHEGERPRNASANVSALSFQSTLPTRGSDKYDAESCALCWYFNPRSPRGGATLRRLWISMI